MILNTPAYVMSCCALLQLGAVVVVSPSSQALSLCRFCDSRKREVLIALDVFLLGLYRVLDKESCKMLIISSVQGLEKRLPGSCAGSYPDRSDDADASSPAG